MERTVSQVKYVEQKTHLFYCDLCGAQLGCTTEYDDGYYEQLGEFELKWYTPNGWYKLHKCLCDTCREKYLTNIYGTLEVAGFKLEKY